MLIFPIFFMIVGSPENGTAILCEHNTDIDSCRNHGSSANNVGIVARGRTSRALRGHCAAPQDQSAKLQVPKMPALRGH